MKRLLLFCLCTVFVQALVARELLPDRWFEDVLATDGSIQRSYVFKSVPGVVYRVQTSDDLSAWNSGPEIYGLGHDQLVPLVEIDPPPPSDPQNPPVPFVPFTSVSLRIQPSSGSSGGIVLSWPSLDHGG